MKKNKLKRNIKKLDSTSYLKLAHRVDSMEFVLSQLIDKQEKLLSSMKKQLKKAKKIKPNDLKALYQKYYYLELCFSKHIFFNKYIFKHCGIITKKLFYKGTTFPYE